MSTDAPSTKKHLTLKLTVVTLLPLALAFVALFIGRYPLSIADVVGALCSIVLPEYQRLVSKDIYSLVVMIRLPRVLAAFAVGAALAISGAAFQGVFRNPLVNPGLLGVSNGAGFGAALAIVLLGGGLFIYPLAFAFGVIAVAASYMIARVYKSTPTIMLILGGTIVSSVFASLVSLMKYVADPSDALPSLVFWLMGSLSDVAFSDFWALAIIVAGCIILLLCSYRIDVLSMGDKEARSLGIEVNRNKALIIGGATLATAGAVSLAGVVGWIGLIIPHIGRMIIGSENRILLPVSIALGGTFLVVVDTFARTITAGELPLGILTALIGAPFFVFLLKRTKGRDW